MVALALLLLVFLAIGKWYPGTGADVLDWQPTRSYEDEIRLEIEDIDEMLEASNERRRRTGRPELTEDQVRLEVEQDLMDQQERAARPEGRVVARVLVVGGAGRARELASSGHVVEEADGRRPGPACHAHAAARGRERGVLALRRVGARRRSTATGSPRCVEYLVDTPVRGLVYERSREHPGRRADRRARARDVQDPVRGRVARATTLARRSRGCSPARSRRPRSRRS